MRNPFCVPARSAVPFIATGSGKPVRALDRATITVTSDGLAWSGVRVEGGTNPPWDVHDLSIAAHYIALNIDPVPLHFEAIVDGRTRGITLEPDHMCFARRGLLLA